jgi:hypothetical protein
MSDCNSADLFEQLKKIINLPDEAISLNLFIEVNKIPVLTLMTYVKPVDLNFEEMQTITEKFELKLIE